MSNLDDIAALLAGVDSIDTAIAKLADAGIHTNVKLEIWPDHIAEAMLDTASGNDFWAIWHKKTGEKRLVDMKPR